jgi:molybdopterin molybdotransferase
MQARRIAADLDPAPVQRVGLVSALGAVLAQPVAALADLPPVPSAEASGWAVAGVGPWTIVEAPEDGSLPDGCALRIPEGAPLPAGTLGVLADRFAVLEDAGATLLIGESGRPAPRPGMLKPGYGVAAAGSGAAPGQILLKPGEIVTAGSIALAAAAGVDDLTITPPGTVAPILLQTDLLSTGPPRRGRDRDVAAPMLSTWVMGSGGRCLPERAVAEEAIALADAVDEAGCELTVITGGRRPGVSSEAVAAMTRLGAEVLIDAVDLRPGGEVVLAELRDGRRVLALPREPAGAVVALALLLNPMLAAVSARASHRWPTAMLREDVEQDTSARALPVVVEPGELADLALVRGWSGPHGLAALAGADGIAFFDRGKGRRGESVPVVPLPSGG